MQVALAPYLVAVGDGERLLVYRSSVMNDTDPACQYVAEYIESNGMVLVSEETGLYDGMFGMTERTHWAIPAVRNQLMRNKEESE